MIRFAALSLVLLPGVLFPPSVAAEEADAGLAEVYSDESLHIRAGIDEPDDASGFGDVFGLTIVIDFDPDTVEIDDLDEELFAAAWTPAEGAYLRSTETSRERVDGELPERLRANYRFQFLGCPDPSRATCPADRQYPVPEFVLDYTNRLTDSPASLTFRLPETSLTLKSAIERDADGQLFPFEVYFPNGGYPDPRAGRDGTRGALLIAGLATAILTGGILMWPFRSRNKDDQADAIPRWKKELDELRGADPGDEARYLDGLRRCLVWYCNDELEVDAFVWLDLAERGDEVRDAAEDDVSFTKLRDLFVELLHNPKDKGPELKSRLEALIAQGGHA